MLSSFTGTLKLSVLLLLIECSLMCLMVLYEINHIPMYEINYSSVDLFSNMLICQSIVSPLCTSRFDVSCCVGDSNSILKSIMQN